MPSKGSKTYKYIADPKTGKSVAEHRIIMEQKLGRKLKPGETVDHIDGNEQNNKPSNLRVISGHKNDSIGGTHGAAITNAKRGRQGKKSR